MPVKAGQESSIAAIADIAMRTAGDERARPEITEVLVLNDDYNVTGAYLTKADRSTRREGKPCVDFNFNTAGGQQFGELTGNHLPDKLTEFTYKLGIVLDDELYSAPTIQKHDLRQRRDHRLVHARRKCEFLVNVLNAGSLPAALTKEPISELYSGATLGQRHDHEEPARDAHRVDSRAAVHAWSTIASPASWPSSRWSLNMLILFAVMLAFKAAFTLTGFAGLALTVGMAVDNNILVFERLREEHDRGATLRMAIRNAFHRAGTTIIDCNLTHMIAATVLWFLGTDQLKGFAVTLWLGVVTSMYTSVFVSHVIFDDRRKAAVDHATSR